MSTLRAPLSRAHVIRAAMDIADGSGLDSVSMRSVAQKLGVEAMSLYTHVSNKRDLLDGLADAVVEQIPLPPPGSGGHGLREIILNARSTMREHPWAPRTIEQLTGPGPGMLRYLDTLFGALLDDGLTAAQAHYAVHVLGSRALGYSQDVFDDRGAPPATAAADSLSPFPHLLAVAADVARSGGCEYDREFEDVLDLILDALTRLPRTEVR